MKILPMKAPSHSITDEQLLGLSYPLLGSFKLDGLRALGHKGALKSKTMKPFRNRYLNSIMAHPELDGLDGELVVGDPYGPTVLRRAMSGITSFEGEPDFRLYLFDDFSMAPSGFLERHSTLAATLRRLPKAVSQRCEVLTHHMLRSPDDVLRLEEKALAARAEGLMLRSVDGPYKFGRSTLNEGYLLKLKRFLDGEALVLSLEEAQTNTNEAEVREDGARRRSRRQEGMVPAGTLGVIVGRDVKTGDIVRIGPGRMTAKERKAYWERPVDLVGKLVNYRHFPSGTDAARFPTFQAVVDPDTL